MKTKKKARILLTAMLATVLLVVTLFPQSVAQEPEDTMLMRNILDTSIIADNLLAIDDFALDNSENIIVDSSDFDLLVEADQAGLVQALADALMNDRAIYVTGSFEESQELLAEITDAEFTVEVVDLNDSYFLGASAEPMSNGDIAFALYFSDEEQSEAQSIATMLDTNVTDYAYASLGVSAIAPLSWMSAASTTTSIVRVHPVFVHKGTNSEMRITTTLNRRAVARNGPTIWDVDNMIAVTPRGGWQTTVVNTFLDMTRNNNQELIDAGPFTTSGSTQTSFTLGGGFNVGSDGAVSVGSTVGRTFGITTQDMEYITTFSALNGRCDWVVRFTRNRPAARNSSQVRVGIRAINRSGQFVVYTGATHNISNGALLFPTTGFSQMPRLRITVTGTGIV